ncbi:tetratricopeptide repeat protein [Armatimonas sp.]|uniref:tetratricopeptide repeat protein n=1 Tax=Armatimonas sp. TaxID=1872638 RepID=UPI00286A0C44|nr:tetratricopeptide repeat protein [Armatimonas sp.]
MLRTRLEQHLPPPERRAERYAFTVRLQKLDQVVDEQLGWQEGETALSPAQAWLLVWIEERLPDLATILALLTGLTEQGLTLEAPVSQLTHVLATLEHEFLTRDPEEVVADDEALAVFEEAIRLDPASDTAFNNLGFSLLTQGRFVEALTSCDEALWLNPQNVSAQSNRAVALRGLGRYDEALLTYDRALGLEPDSALLHSNRAELLLTLKKYEEALVACEWALVHEPNLVAAHSVRSFVLHALGRYAEAAEGFSRADRLMGQQEPLFLVFQAASLLAIGEQKARQDGLRLLASTRLLNFTGQRLLILRTYQFFHAFSRTSQLQGLREIRQFVDQGILFPPDWHLALAPNIAQAVAAGHPDAANLPELSEVLLGR